MKVNFNNNLSLSYDTIKPAVSDNEGIRRAVQLQEIGRIKQVQIQRSSLKVKEPHPFYDSTSSLVVYDPTPLLVVSRLVVTPKGAIGITTGDEEIMDIHHAHHPHTKNSRGKNDLSIGFTGHYAAMRARFGDWFLEGCAGENILVEAERSFLFDDLKHGLAIQSHKTGQVLFLASLRVAAPCVQFSQYAANFGMPLPPQRLKETLQFLNDGRRGFYAKLAASQEQGSIEANDRVFVVERS